MVDEFDLAVAEGDFFTAFRCWRKRAREFLSGERDDESMRDVLAECGWNEPGPGTLKEAIEWYQIEFDVSFHRCGLGLLESSGYVLLTYTYWPFFF